MKLPPDPTHAYGEVWCGARFLKEGLRRGGGRRRPMPPAVNDAMPSETRRLSMLQEPELEEFGGGGRRVLSEDLSSLPVGQSKSREASYIQTQSINQSRCETSYAKRFLFISQHRWKADASLCLSVWCQGWGEGQT